MTLCVCLSLCVVVLVLACRHLLRGPRLQAVPVPAHGRPPVRTRRR
jgi:hypothetical protein